MVYAIVLIIFYQYGFIQWHQSGHSFAEAWHTMRQDWLTLITFIDATQFSLLVLGWLAFDLKHQKQSTWEKFFWFGLTVWLGVSGLLLYGLWRRQPRFV